MHAFLIVGQDQNEVDKRVNLLSKRIGKQNFEFFLKKIDEVRNLGEFTKLSQNIPTCIIIKNFQEATQEAMNAFLKNLEEPQKNITYILTATSAHKLLPTVVSRCQVVRVLKRSSNDVSMATNFLKLSTSDRFSLFDKIKSREEACDYVENLILSLHTLLISGKENLNLITQMINAAQATFDALNANGNVNLQLTNFTTNLSKRDQEIQIYSDNSVFNSDYSDRVK